MHSALLMCKRLSTLWHAELRFFGGTARVIRAALIQAAKWRLYHRGESDNQTARTVHSPHSA